VAEWLRRFDCEMMIAALLGVPLLIWGCLCLLVAGIYLIYCPGFRGAGRPGAGRAWRRVVLRWFHPLVWLLLGLSCFIWGGYIAGGAAVANILAVASLVIYVIFMLTFVRERRPRNHP
jgi:hypothetical protein